MLQLASMMEWTGGAWAGVLLDLTIKGTALLVFGGGLALAARRATAAARHLIWMATIVGLLLVPVLSVVLPAWRILPAWATTRGEVQPVVMPKVETGPVAGPVMVRELPGAMPVEVAGPVAAQGGDERPAARVKRAEGTRMSWGGVLVVVWGVGVLVAMVPVVLSPWLLAQLRRRAEVVRDSMWVRLCDVLRAALGLGRQVALLKTQRRSVPMTFGIFWPKILLPGEAEGWSAERRRVVLLHELAHVKRWDCLTFLLARVARCVFWFHPLVWVACARLSVERERACDDMVLRAGTRSSEYASELLSIASGFVGHVPGEYGALAMARPSTLEGRLLAILDGKRNRRKLAVTTAGVILVLVAGVMVPLASMRARAADKAPTTEPASNIPAGATVDPVEAVKRALPEGWSVLEEKGNEYPAHHPSGHGTALYLKKKDAPTGGMIDYNGAVYVMPVDYVDGGDDPTHGEVTQTEPAKLVGSMAAGKIYLWGGDDGLEAALKKLVTGAAATQVTSEPAAKPIKAPLTREELLAAATKVRAQFADLDKRYAALADLIQPGMTKFDLQAVLPVPIYLSPGEVATDHMFAGTLENWNGDVGHGGYEVEGGYAVEYEVMHGATGGLVLTVAPRILSPKEVAAKRAASAAAATRAANDPDLAALFTALNHQVLSGWTMQRTDGQVQPTNLALGQGIQLAFPPVKPEGKFVPLTLWIMDSDYEGGAAPPMTAPGTPVAGPARELDRWNGRRVFILDAYDKGWPGAVAQIEEILKGTGGPLVAAIVSEKKDGKETLQFELRNRSDHAVKVCPVSNPRGGVDVGYAVFHEHFAPGMGGGRGGGPSPEMLARSAIALPPGGNVHWALAMPMIAPGVHAKLDAEYVVGADIAKAAAIEEAWAIAPTADIRVDGTGHITVTSWRPSVITPQADAASRHVGEGMEKWSADLKQQLASMGTGIAPEMQASKDEAGRVAFAKFKVALHCDFTVLNEMPVTFTGEPGLAIALTLNRAGEWNDVALAADAAQSTWDGKAITREYRVPGTDWLVFATVQSNDAELGKKANAAIDAAYGKLVAIAAEKVEALPGAPTTIPAPTTQPAPRLQIRLVFPAEDKTAEEFPDPMHAGQSVRVDRKILLDESDMESSSGGIVRVNAGHLIDTASIRFKLKPTGGAKYAALTPEQRKQPVALIVDAKLLAAGNQENGKADGFSLDLGSEGRIGEYEAFDAAANKVVFAVSAIVPLPPVFVSPASPTPGTAPATGLAAHSFYLRRILPDTDTTTPADTFPDPAHPGQSLRLAKTPLIDQSALNCATITNGLLIDLLGPGAEALFKARAAIAPEPFRTAAVIDGQLLPPGELQMQINSDAIYYVSTPIAAKDLPIVQQFAAILNAMVIQRPGAVLKGQLLDKPGGKGVPNIAITIALADQDSVTLTATTGPDGFYQFPNVPSTRQSFFFRIDKQSPGERFDTYIYDRDIGKTKTLTLYINPPTVSGHVLDKLTGKPIAHMLIHTSQYGGDTLTDEQGAYHIAYVPDFPRHSIEVSGNTSYLPVSKTFDATPALDVPNFDFELEKVPSVEFDVVVLGPDGNPAPNASLEVKTDVQNIVENNENDGTPPFVAFTKPATDAQGRARATVYFPGKRGLQNFKTDTLNIKISARVADHSAVADATIQLAPGQQPDKPLQLRAIPIGRKPEEKGQ